MEKEEICERAMKYSSGGAMDLCAELSESVDVLLRQWATLHSYVDGMHDCERHCMMAQCLLQWRSRRIYNFHSEVRMMMMGLNLYASDSSIS
jgi:hypothetical protein